MVTPVKKKEIWIGGVTAKLHLQQDHKHENKQLSLKSKSVLKGFYLRWLIFSINIINRFDIHLNFFNFFPFVFYV